MVLGGEVYQRILIHRANQRGSWRPLLIIWKDGLGYDKIRIVLLNVQVLCRVLGFLEVQALRRTHGATILDKKDVARILSRCHLPALCLNLTRPRGLTSETGSKTHTEKFQQFAAAQVLDSFSH